MIKKKTSIQSLIGFFTKLEDNSSDRSENGNVYLRPEGVRALVALGDSPEDLDIAMKYLENEGIVLVHSGDRVVDQDFLCEVVDIEKGNSLDVYSNK